MREIKFRAWDSKPLEGKAKMIYGIDSIKTFYEGIYLIDEVLNPEKAGAPEIKIMQFTGLKDKNGKEIYEGDIIQGDYENNKERGAVYWNTETASFDVDDSEWRSCENLECSEEYYEVIGNIYENPEFLKCKKTVTEEEL